MEGTVSFTVLVLFLFVGCSEEVIIGNLQVRLVGGLGDGNSGRVEVRRFNNESWSTVCSNLWDAVDAAVVCRNLHPDNKWGLVQRRVFPPGTGRIYLGDTQCRGNETNLGQCQTSSWGNPSPWCSHDYDAQVTCFKNTVRLVPQLGGSKDAKYGEVQVLRQTDYRWMSLCNDSTWTDNAAIAICKSLGFVSGKALNGGALSSRYTSYPYRAYGSVRNVTCNSGVTSFASCTYVTAAARCSYTTGKASAVCYSTTTPDMSFQIRLANQNSNNWGKVEVRHLGVYGHVCAGSQWNSSAASVACREIKGQGGGVALGRSWNDVLKGSGWVTGLNCTGSESSLQQCVVPPWGRYTSYSTCYPQYALCYTRSEPEVRLAGGSSPSHGRVEITVDDVTYTVCGDNNWNTRDANVVCRSLGFSGGEALRNSHYGPGTGAVALSRLGCSGRETSLLQCPNNGWRNSSSTCDGNHNNDASVYCYDRQVRLQQGDHSTGVVQVATYYRRRIRWRTLCGTGFDDNDATVVCRDLGFQNGRALPQGSYGRFSYSNVWSNLTCRGDEESVFNCTRSHSYCYRSYTNYASVHCYNGTLDTTSRIWLIGGSGDYANASGHVRVLQSGVQGKVCPLYWDDSDAKVACRQLGFSNGVAYGLGSGLSGPFLISVINCAGTERNLSQCPRANASCSDRSLVPDAGAFCFDAEAPQVELVGGSSESEGRVEMVFKDIRGTVCTSYYKRQAASVVCKSKGYVTGEAKTFPAGTGRVVLSGIVCYDTESSLLSCYHNGFLATPSPLCQDHANDLGVRCLGEVRLYRKQQETNTTVVGIVQLYKNNEWKYVCGDGFDDAKARLFCQKLNYGYARALSKGALGSVYYIDIVGSINCTGREQTLGECSYQVSQCPNGDRYNNYASVICSRQPIPRGISAQQPVTNPGVAVFQVDGVKSSLCSRQWSSSLAQRYCTALNYRYGAVFGRTSRDRYSAMNTVANFVSNITCRNSATPISNCTATIGTCRTSSKARVFCYNSQSDFQVRLNGGVTRYEGQVEVGIGGQWGSVCDYRSSWTANDATVACRSLGFAGGDPLPANTFGQAKTPALVISPSCDGTEANITACYMSYFNTSRPYITNPCTSSPAAVRCSGEVKLTPNTTYGAVQMLLNVTTGTYGLVCSDGFGANEATVACRDLGFTYGVSLCCSAFGYIYRPRIRRTGLKCTGREAELSDCAYSDNLYCPYNKYASVVCSNLSPSSGYSVGVEPIQNFPYGRAQVTHMGHTGYICPDGFDNNDANVICREAGYQGGISFDYYQYRYGVSSAIRWLSNLGCTGTERSLMSCPNVIWGNVTRCSRYGDAAVFCYQNSAPQFKLVNGTGTSGRLELWADDMHGTVCGRYWNDMEASAACKGMGYNGGRLLAQGTFGQGTGEVLVDYASCYGREKSLFDCYLRLKGTRSYSYCDGHDYDVAVQCFNTTRITGSKLKTYGRVEVLSNQTWVAVCDQGFTTTAARVVCRALGYSEARKQCCSAVGPLNERYNYYNLRASSIGLVVNSCDGSEASLLDCDVSTTATCPTNNYVSVLCSNDPITERRLQTRLRETVYGISRTYLGGVLVNRYGFWGPVCNSSWDNRDANATCHGLNFTYGISFYGRDTTSLPMVMGNFNCTGRESSLADCSFGDIDDDINCSLPLYNYRRTDAGVLCYNTPGVPQLRLTDGGSTYGRLEVEFEGRWGRVADYWWNSLDATVACKQLGYLGGRPMPYRMRVNHPVRSAKVWMNYVSCSGHESTLFQCYNRWDYQGYYASDANVICYHKVRLSRGDMVTTGVVEVNINGKWGTVCDNQWNDRDTQVTCQNLGFDNGFHLCCDAYGRTYYPIMDRVQCGSSDTDLSTCPHSVPSNRICPGGAVSVACYKGATPTTYTYSLNSGYQSNNTGEVLIDFMNVTGRICSDGWDDTDALVFCKEQGFQHGTAYEHFLYTYSRYNRGPFWATNVNCQGSEARLRDCQITPGTVRSCSSGKAAGVLCTTNEGIFYRLGPVNGASGYKGRVEVSVDGVWGSVCRSYFNYREADVFCRSLGFNDGRMDYSSYTYDDAPTRIFEARFRCDGSEDSLEECPHNGFKPATSAFCSHQKDAKVICFNDVRIGLHWNTLTTQGPVQYYNNGTWYMVCDTGFDDVTASQVCRDLEFESGVAVCCSAYGSRWYGSYNYASKLNYSMQCKGSEKTSAQCVTSKPCQSGNYASVVCFGADQVVNQTAYRFDFSNTSLRHGVVAVRHMNVTGRVCNRDWDDADARVLCRTKGHLDGVAYHYSRNNYVSLSTRGPYWVSSVNCTGNETRLESCPFSDRLHLGNCSTADAAGAMCFNESGIQYNISATDPRRPFEGRVQMSVGGVWGTVCHYYWDDRDARVLCRSLGYHDGFSIRNPFYYSPAGSPSSPMWLSGLQCSGNESNLHQCPHRGFNDAPLEDGYYSYGCKSHTNDAFVSCVNDLKLNLGYNASLGAVMVYDKAWRLICDTSFHFSEASVVCQQLGFPHGTILGGSVFGSVEGASISITNAHCDGTEKDFTKCRYDVSSSCRSGKYASVVCGQTKFVEADQTLRVLRENPNDPRYGLLERQVSGVWGGVCAATFDSKAATVACKQMGFNGGVPYRPRFGRYHYPPILTWRLKCSGSESFLDECSTTASSSAWCDYNAPRAGVICYNSTDGGVSYRLAGDESLQMRGRFEMSYMQQFGIVCSFFSRNISRVACRSMGYSDGMPLHGSRYATNDEPIWFFYTACTGNESAIPECYSGGFNTGTSRYTSYYERLCRGNRGPLSVQCYTDQIELTRVRLVLDGVVSNSSGRVEVYLTGPNEWGTVCDDQWSDVDATVLCRQLGFNQGVAVREAGFGQGNGSIWLDNVGCRGTEIRIQDCGFNGFNVHNCRHSEDAGVRCSGVYVPPTTTTMSTKASPSGKPPNTMSTGKTGLPPDTQKQTDNDDGGSNNAAAIAVPIVVIMIVAVLGVIGFLMYRRRQNWTNTESLTSEGAAPNKSLSFSPGGVVQFFKGRKQEDRGATNMDGLSNPNYDTGLGHSGFDSGISNPGFDSASSVQVQQHADFSSDA